MSLSIALEKIKAVCVAGAWVEIDPDAPLEYDDECQIVDEDGETVVESESPVLSFTGKDKCTYIVSLNATAFRVKG